MCVAFKPIPKFTSFVFRKGVQARQYPRLGRANFRRPLFKGLARGLFSR
jgi:hypothetical protein